MPSKPLSAPTLPAFTLVLPWPPTNNTYWRHPTSKDKRGNVHVLHLVSEKGRAYREEAAWHIKQQLAKLRMLSKVPITSLVVVTGACYQPDRRRRDTDNLRKALFDTLTFAGVWQDDCLVDDDRFYRVRQDDGELVLGGVIELEIRELLIKP